MATALPDGILLFDKPIGISSFDVIRRLKYAARHEGQPLSHLIRPYVSEDGKKLKIGHAGTLDPLASGLMVIGVGPGTKRLHDCVGLPKVYDAEVCLGEQSATSDAEGPILATCVVPDIPETVLKETVDTMVGVLRLPVSGYSAMKQGGESLYKKMRRGESPVLPIRDMEVQGALYMDAIRPSSSPETLHVHVRFSVGSGTYVRSLAEEFGRRLGYCARLENLRRTQVGEWRVEDAVSIE